MTTHVQRSKSSIKKFPQGLDIINEMLYNVSMANTYDFNNFIKWYNNSPSIHKMNPLKNQTYKVLKSSIVSFNCDEKIEEFRLSFLSISMLLFSLLS